jgi:hypothetical protein
VKKGMRKVLEEVITEVLRLLPPEVPEFNKVAGFGFTPKIYKSKRKTR